MNKYIENINQQIQNTLELMQKRGYIVYYNLPKIEEIKGESRLFWNNHKGGREVSSKYFLRVEQYLKILSDNAYLAIFNDFSIIRCAFTFIGNKIVSENLLWWPCPIKVDNDMANEFGIVETIECMLQEADLKRFLLMRSPIRIDFDVANDNVFHPRAHVHIESEECRINSNVPICFNRFINHLVKCYYPSWHLYFSNSDYLNFQFDNPKKKEEYYNKTEIYFE